MKEKTERRIDNIGNFILWFGIITFFVWMPIRFNDVYNTIHVTQGPLSSYEKQTKMPEKKDVQRTIDQNYFGEKKDVGEWTLVRAVNPRPVIQESENGRSFRIVFHSGTCGIGRSSNTFDDSGVERERGKIGNKTLFEYTVKGNRYGTACPSGILFLG